VRPGANDIDNPGICHPQRNEGPSDLDARLPAPGAGAHSQSHSTMMTVTGDLLGKGVAVAELFEMHEFPVELQGAHGLKAAPAVDGADLKDEGPLLQ